LSTTKNGDVEMICQRDIQSNVVQRGSKIFVVLDDRLEVG